MTTKHERLTALRNKITDLPWRISRLASTAVQSGERGICSTGGYADNTRPSEDVHEENDANANFIVSSCNELPALLALVRQQHEALEKAKNTLINIEWGDGVPNTYRANAQAAAKDCVVEITAYNEWNII
jgi:hypothetical protein